MNAKAIILAIVVVLIAAVAWFSFANKATAPSPITTTGDVTEDAPEEVTPAQTPTITYTDNGFSPKTAQVGVGTTVVFMNNSTRTLWVASDDHPSHTKYDGTSKDAHCATGTSFDQCKAVPAGQSYSFTFTKAGTWAYHNHTRANDTGTIIVK